MHAMDGPREGRRGRDAHLLSAPALVGALALARRAPQETGPRSALRIARR
jgi:hypothetical protein